MNIIINRHPNLVSEPLIKKINYIYVTDFDEDSYKKFKEDFNNCLSAGMTIIPIVIDSFGGGILSAIGKMNIITNSPVPVATIVETKAMSAGALLFSCGTKGLRFIAPNAKIMIHEAAHWTGGKITETVSRVKFGEELNDQMLNIMDKNCNQAKGFFKTEISKRNNADWFVTAKEAKRIRIADQIKTPNLVVTVNQTMQLE